MACSPQVALCSLLTLQDEERGTSVLKQIKQQALWIVLQFRGKLFETGHGVLIDGRDITLVQACDRCLATDALLPGWTAMI
jgi:hypothetical protein